MEAEHFREQYQDSISSLQNNENKSAILNQLLELLSRAAANEVSVTIRSIGISKIVQQLNVRDGKQVNVTCEVLKLCFEKLGPVEFIKRYMGYIMYFLRHENQIVRRLAVDEIGKAVILSCNALPLPQYIDLYVAVAQLVGDEDISVANKAIMITSNLPQEAYARILDEMKILLEFTSSSKCNTFEVIINISEKSFELFNLCVEMGYLDVMLLELQTDDVLYQLNILELLSRLVIKPYGLNHFLKNGLMNKLAGLLVDLENKPLGGILIPGYMKFFGCVAHHFPKEIFDKYPVLTDCLFEKITNGNSVGLLSALDTFGFIGCTIEAKLSFVAKGSKYLETLEKLSQLIHNSPSGIKIRAINCFSNLISIDKDTSVPKTGPVDHRVTLMTREWFRGLSDEPTAMDYLFELCRNPFPDIKLAAFGLLDSVCQHQWGHELVACSAGFIEYLLDRSVVISKECKEAKYDIIRRLANSASFDVSIISRLQAYVEEGPFFSGTTLEVAMEEAD